MKRRTGSNEPVYCAVKARPISYSSFGREAERKGNEDTRSNTLSDLFSVRGGSELPETKRREASNLGKALDSLFHEMGPQKAVNSVAADILIRLTSALFKAEETGGIGRWPTKLMLAALET